MGEKRVRVVYEVSVAGGEITEPVRMTQIGVVSSAEGARSRLSKKARVWMISQSKRFPVAGTDRSRSDEDGHGPVIEGCRISGDGEDIDRPLKRAGAVPVPRIPAALGNARGLKGGVEEEGKSFVARSSSAIVKPEIKDQSGGLIHMHEAVDGVIKFFGDAILRIILPGRDIDIPDLSSLDDAPTDEIVGRNIGHGYAGNWELLVSPDHAVVHLHGRSGEMERIAGVVFDDIDGVEEVPVHSRTGQDLVRDRGIGAAPDPGDVDGKVGLQQLLVKVFPGNTVISQDDVTDLEPQGMVRHDPVNQRGAIGQGRQAGAEMAVVPPGTDDKERDSRRGRRSPVDGHVADIGVRLLQGEGDMVHDGGEPPPAHPGFDLGTVMVSQ